MTRRWKRIWMWLTMLLGGATMFQALGGFTTADGAVAGTCGRFFTNGIATSVDFCFLLDCRNGFIGGLVSPCGDPNDPTDDLIVDCPGPIGGTGGTGTNDGTGTNTGTSTGTGTGTGTNTQTGSAGGAGFGG